MLTDWPPGPGRALDVDPEVALLVDLDLDLVDLGQDDDRHGRGVDPARRLGRRDPLDAMDAALELEPAVRAVAVDLEDRLLDPADPGLVEAQDLGLEAVALGVADVHPVELGREQRRLLAAGAAADLHDHVAAVVRVARQEEDLELLEQARLVGLEPGDLVAGHPVHLVVGIGRVAKLARAGQLGPRRLEPAEGLDDRLEPRQLLAETADRRRVGRRLGACQLRLDLVVLPGDLRQLGVEIAHRPGGGSVGSGGAAERGALGRAAGAGTSVTVSAVVGRSIGRCAKSPEPAGTVSPSASSACSIDTMATSIMSSVGCLVVIIWTRRPG